MSGGRGGRGAKRVLANSRNRRWGFAMDPRGHAREEKGHGEESGAGFHGSSFVPPDRFVHAETAAPPKSGGFPRTPCAPPSDLRHALFDSRWAS